MRRNATLLGMAVAAVSLVLTGCSSDDSTAAATPSTPKEELLLIDSDFPSGAQKQEITSEQLKGQAGELVDIMAGADISPPECAVKQKDFTEAIVSLFDDAGVVAYVAEGTMYTEIILDREQDLQQIAESNDGPCAVVTSKVEVDGQQAESTVQVVNLVLPDSLRGTGAIAFSSATSTTVGDTPPVDSTEYSGYAVVRGKTIGVRAVGFAGEPDQAVFDKLFADAVRKVEEAT